jgi:hypothetical protein
MDSRPYRHLALVEPYGVAPKLAEALPFVDDTTDRTCPKCGRGRYKPGPLEPVYCDGRRRWWRPWGCRLGIDHFHMRCDTCGARWLMRTKDQ